MFYNKNYQVFVPDGTDIKTALERTTHLAISSHHDDIELMAFHGILECYRKNDKWFCGAVVTDGANSSRGGCYKNFTDDEMAAIRRVEQKEAATVGEYGACVLLEHSSDEVKDTSSRRVIDDIKTLILSTMPTVLYTHNPADKHLTHVGVVMKVITAIRELPLEARPKELYGCEVWRGLDWLSDNDKVVFDVSGKDNLSSALLGVYDSQICGGKRYDIAALGRRTANATFLEDHNVDKIDEAIFAMDLSPLLKDDSLNVLDIAMGHIDKLRNEVSKNISKYLLL